MINVRYLSGLALSLATVGLVGACADPPNTPSGTYSLSGIVTQMTSSGKAPIPGVVVKEGNTHRQAVTDDSGRYSLAGLPAGVVTIQVSGWRFESASRTVTVTVDTTVDVELQPRDQFTVSGFVSEETPAGRIPLAGVLVQAMVCPPQPNGGYTLVEVETDSNGSYSLSGMCNGETILYAWKAGYDLPRPTGRPCGNEGEWCRVVMIAGNTRFDLQLIRY